MSIRYIRYSGIMDEKAAMKAVEKATQAWEAARVACAAAKAKMEAAQAAYAVYAAWTTTRSALAVKNHEKDRWELTA